jgi:hypothetical protein
MNRDNFSILHTIASVVSGNTLPVDAVTRMTAINAPEWIIRGLLSAGCCAAEQGTNFGFNFRWFGQIAELERAENPADEPMGEC